MKLMKPLVHQTMQDSPDSLTIWSLLPAQNVEPECQALRGNVLYHSGLRVVLHDPSTGKLASEVAYFVTGSTVKYLYILIYRVIYQVSKPEIQFSREG